MEAFVNFLVGNIALIMLGAAVLYFIFFFWNLVRRQRTGEGFRFSIRSLFAFGAIIAIAIYCLVKGIDFREFIG